MLTIRPMENQDRPTIEELTSPLIQFWFHMYVYGVSNDIPSLRPFPYNLAYHKFHREQTSKIQQRRSFDRQTLIIFPVSTY